MGDDARHWENKAWDAELAQRAAQEERDRYREEARQWQGTAQRLEQEVNDLRDECDALQGELDEAADAIGERVEECDTVAETIVALVTEFDRWRSGISHHLRQERELRFKRRNLEKAAQYVIDNVEGFEGIKDHLREALGEHQRG